MQIEEYLLNCSNEFENVFHTFWYPAETFPKTEAVRALADKQGWLQPKDKLEWQRTGHISYLALI